MKKVVGMAALNLACVVFLWFLLGISVTEITGGNFVQNVSGPFFMISCGAAGLITTVFTIVKEKAHAMAV